MVCTVGSEPDLMRVLTMDVDWNVGPNQTTYNSLTSLLDYDLIVWDPTGIERLYRSSNAQWHLDNVRSQLFLDDSRRRGEELHAFLRLGRLLVVLVPSHIYLNYIVPNEGWKKKSLLSLTHVVDSVEVVNSTGSSIEYRGDARFGDFWSVNKGRLTYRSYMPSPPGKPFLFVPGTNRTVGSWLETGGGHVLFLPGDVAEDHRSLFLQTLVDLAERLTLRVDPDAIPEWALQYRLPGEADLESRRAALLEEVASMERSLSSIQMRKALLGAKGELLEEQVLKAFQNIGLDAMKGERGREDIVLKYRDRVAVVEVKGLAKSASEANAAQLEKWVVEYMMANSGSKPKGILVVNAFHSKDVAHRNEPAFPNQMVGFSKNRDHCLLTTVQLLCMSITVETDPTKRDEVIEALFGTSGVVDQFTDWMSYVKPDITV